jgi:hypothetical protein
MSVLGGSFAFAFSPSLTGRPVASERDENIAEWIITNAAQSAPHEEAGRRNFPISKEFSYFEIGIIIL